MSDVSAGVKVLIVDDHAVVRAGLKSFLEEDGDYTIVGEAENGRQAVDLARTFRPDVVVMNISMPNLNGIGTTRQLLENDPNTRVVILTVRREGEYVRGALQAGARAYVLKEDGMGEIRRAIQEVLKDHVHLSPKVAGHVVTEYLSAADQHAEENELTGREREVLQLIAEGYTNKKIADTLNISPKTVDAHRQRIMSKLDLHNVVELTKYAIREGITAVTT